MAYQAIYRKWRPQVFEDIIGQSHITTTLKNQIVNERVSHAYLFCGTRGTGKTTAAKVFAKAVNCLNSQNGSPCNECEICKGIQNGSIMDITEIDAASNNSVDNIRDLRDDVNYVATQTKYRVYIIDEVHMLSTGAFNALLKTLEEPPAHVIFILATTEVHKIPETILSRCQRFDFKRITPSDIIIRMKEIAYGDGLDITEDAYLLLAEMADGSMRDGLSILERCVSACGTHIDTDSITSVLGIAKSTILFELADAIINGNTKEALNYIDIVSKEGKDLNVFCDSLIKHFRDLLVCKISQNPDSMLDYSKDMIVKLNAQKDKASFEKLSNVTSVLTKAKADAKWVKNPRVNYELALIKLTRPELDTSNEALLDRLASVEEAAKNGIVITKENISKEEKKEEEIPKKKDDIPARLYAPLDIKSLTQQSPLVKCARNWDKISSAICRKLPYISGILPKSSITIDGEGILLMFEETESAIKNLAVKYIDVIQKEFENYTKSGFKIKVVFKKDVEDAIVDLWSLPKGEASEDEDDQSIATISTNTLEGLMEAFPEIVTKEEEPLEDMDLSKVYQEDIFESDKEEFLDDAELAELTSETDVNEENS